LGRVDARRRLFHEFVSAPSHRIFRPYGGRAHGCNQVVCANAGDAIRSRPP
jgi:hypothetical protein